MIKQTKLFEIFALRGFLLHELNPSFYEQIVELVVNSSFAAQDWIVSDNFYRSFPRIMERSNFSKFTGYVKLIKKYGLNSKAYPFPDANNFIPYYLSIAYLEDYSDGMIDKKGNIVFSERLGRSSVLKVFHDCKENGMPNEALKQFKSTQYALQTFRSHQVQPVK